MKVRPGQIELFLAHREDNADRAPIRYWIEGEPVDCDLFAGGGGASEGKRRATGRSPHVAVNHWLAALAMHGANHADCEHHCADVHDVVPLEATKGRRCRFLWASPTCTDFSRASGKRLSPDTIKIRALAGCILPWLRDVRPEVVLLENVKEFLGWGPVCWDHRDGCPGVVDESGKSCDKPCNYGRPIKERRGESFAEFEAAIRALGYSFEWRVLAAWEYGAPTTRERLYIVMCADGQPFAWPETTHVRPEDVAATGKKPWRVAAEIIDWSIPCPSIFDRKTPHVPATRRRLARGMRKFVLEAKQPFLMHLTHGDRHAPHSIEEPVPTVTAANRGEQSLVVPSFILPVKTWGGGGNEPRSMDEPMRTVTASKRGEFAVGVPFMIHRSNGERQGQDPRVYDVNAPHPTVVAGGIKTAQVVAFVAKAYSERPTGGWNGGAPLDQPLGTVTAQDHNHLVAAHTVKFYGTSTGHDARDPLATVTGGGGKHGLVAASLLRYNGKSVGQTVDTPIGTLDARDRYSLAQYAVLRYHGERRPGEEARGVGLDEPMSTLDASNRFALMEAAATEWNDIVAAKARRVYRFLVDEGIDGPWLDHDNEIVWMPGTDLVIWDIGMRMLVPRELFRANGFGDDYVIDLIGPRGKPLTKTEQVRLVGNSVCPDVAEALYRAALARPPAGLQRWHGETRRAA